jgi:hypothetical protein
MPTKKKTSVKKPAKKGAKKPGFTPAVFDDHVDLMKLIYGSCGACPSATMCGSAEVEKPKKKKK